MCTHVKTDLVCMLFNSFITLLLLIFKIYSINRNVSYRYILGILEFIVCKKYLKYCL